MSELEKWAREVDQGIQAERTREAHRTAEIAVIGQLINQNAERLWEEIQEAFDSVCNAFNEIKGKKVIIFHHLSSNIFIVRPDGGTESLTSVYVPSTKSVRVQSGHCNLSETYDLVVVGDEVQFASYGRTKRCEDIAKECLGTFFRVCKV
jgi:hypothetical protein